jgi:hypothetical protein
MNREDTQIWAFTVSGNARMKATNSSEKSVTAWRSGAAIVLPI